jgi:predicted enzyme related to lactoylglutathione lyase
MVPGMALRANQVTIDCADPRALAGFWTRALDYTVIADYDWYLVLRPATPPGFTLGLQRVPAPRTGKNTVHVDLHADDRETEVARLTGLGAKIVDEHHIPGYAWSVLSDPEGNVFCVGADE